MVVRTAGILLLVGATVLGQTRGTGTTPIDERILGQRVTVPPISERITVTPLEDGPGAFSATPSSGASRIFGVVINELGLIVPAAGFVLIRSLRDGKVMGRTQVDQYGQFSMPGVDPGLYSAELVNGAGGVITSSPAFTVGVGEIVQLTPVVSSSSIGGLASLVGNSTAGAVNSAVNAGVSALATPACVSPPGCG